MKNSKTTIQSSGSNPDGNRNTNNQTVGDSNMKNSSNETDFYEYEYVGKWYILDLDTDEILRTEKDYFSVVCKYPLEMWNKMEKDFTDEFSDLISDSYMKVCIDYDSETEYTDGNEDYWRIDNQIQRNVKYLIERIEELGYSYQREGTGCPFYSWDEDLNLTTHELQLFIWDENNPDDQFTVYYWEVLDLDEGEIMFYDENEPLGYSELGKGCEIINFDLCNEKEIEKHLSLNLKKFSDEIYVEDVR